MSQRLIPVTVGGKIEYIPDPAQDSTPQNSAAQNNGSGKQNNHFDDQTI